MRSDQDSVEFCATFPGLSEEERDELQRITLDEDFVEATRSSDRLPMVRAMPSAAESVVPDRCAEPPGPLDVDRQMPISGRQSN